MRNRIFFFCLVLIVFSVFFASAATTGFYGASSGSSRYVQYQQPDFRHYYSGDQIQDYWPILAEDQKEVCEGRQDLLINVAPLGCQPAVVRSDLLAEQNVPVFCQLDALRVNPLIEIKQIRNIRFTGTYPQEVAGVGFHPAQAALRTQGDLLGSPLLNNIGYVVVLLRRQANESAQPDFVNFTLQAQVDYYADNVLGVGTSSFYLQSMSDAQWAEARLRQSFFNGRYFIRLDEVNDEQARISIYYGDSRVSSTTVSLGSKAERVMYLPGSYCQLGLRAYFDRFEPARPIAQLQVGDDLVDVVEGGRFAHERCVVRSVISTGSEAGRVDIACGSQSFSLELTPRVFEKGDLVLVSGRESEGVFSVESVDSKKGVYSLRATNGTTVSVDYLLVYSTESGRLTEFEHSDKDLEAYFDKAIAQYRLLAQDYPLEKSIATQSIDSVASFGQQGLERAISLAEEVGKQRTAAELIGYYLEIYPDADRASYFDQHLRYDYKYDTNAAVAVVDLNGQTTSIRLRAIVPPHDSSRADFSWNGQRFSVALERNYTFAVQKSLGVLSLDKDRVRVVADCGGTTSSREERTLSLVSRVQGSSEGRTTELCGGVLRLEAISVENYAHIRLVPEARGPTVQTNFSVGVGIEQRAIKLAPDKIQERIDTLNKTIAKWESISEGLGNVVKTMKAACFATAGVLTVKNFVTGLDGTALARQKVMRGPDGWTEYCRGRVNAQDGGPSYSSLGECYKDNSARIDQDVSTMSSLIQADNTCIRAAESGATQSSGTFGTYVNGEKAKEAFIQRCLKGYEDERIRLSDGSDVSVSELTKNVSGSGTVMSYQELKDLKLNLELQKRRGDSPVAGNLSHAQLSRLGDSVNGRIESIENQASIADLAGGQVEQIQGEFSRTYNYYGQSVSNDGQRYGLSSDVLPTGSAVQVIMVPDQGVSKPYLAVLDPANPTTGLRSVNRYYALKEQSGAYVVEDAEPDVISSEAGRTIGQFRQVSRASCINRFDLSDEARTAHFYETEPYKGMPAFVPFDFEQGWYVGTRQTVAAFGGIKAFQSSGRPVSFWICNVGGDKRPDFFVNGFDDDICQQFNLETGAPLTKFSCLSESETKDLVDRAVRALEEAAHQYSQGAKDRISVEGQSVKVGAPATNVPGTQCQDFMSPDDCRLLFNVCDPVICPASRCDFGGTYPVTDVIQSGIVGSALLCLPNWNEGVYVPVCLSGIKAGLDSYISVLKSHKQCLQENLESGKYIGICDQISAIYMCEFFWRQAAPVANILLPKLVESLYGQGGARGGGEYATVQASWDNAQQSVNYFTQSYAANSFKAFNVRSVADAGGEFCKAFISAKAPTQFESLIEPDSPPQFHAWFSQIPYSDATVPATAQYKVFYHIFAGDDQGVSYQVYLKDPPQTSYYQSTSTIYVDSGYVSRGSYKTETKDFTAPSGYQQLCVRVNDKEECGFKQVSTSFAVNAVRDEFVQGELEQTDVATERECISGRVNPSALLNPNLQEMGQEALDPAIYNRGVTRICATDNPGRATDPARFVKVGVCDDARVGCWLDTQSVDRAITVNNKGVRNETLEKLQTMAEQQLRDDTQFLFGDDELRLIESLDGRVKKDSLGATEADGIIREADSLFDKVIVNAQKAELLFIKGKAYEAVTRGLWIELKKKSLPKIAAPQDTPATSSQSSGSSDTSSQVVGEESLRIASLYSRPAEGWDIESALRVLDLSDASIVYAATSDEGKAFTAFVDQLVAQKIISSQELNDINGGWFGLGREDAAHVKDLLLKKRAREGYHVVLTTASASSRVYRIMNGKEYTGLYMTTWPSVDLFTYFVGDSVTTPLKADAARKERIPFVDIFVDSSAGRVSVGKVKSTGEITFIDRDKASIDGSIVDDLTGAVFDGYRFVPKGVTSG